MGIFSQIDHDESMTVPWTDDHIVYAASRQDGVLFSCTRKGNALSCHFSSDKEGLRLIRELINEFCDFAFKKYDWCRMIIAQIDRNSVKKVVEKCGFKNVASKNGLHIYARLRDGIYY